MSRVKKGVVLLVLVFSVLSIFSLSFADSGSADVHPLVAEKLAQDGVVSVIVMLKEEQVSPPSPISAGGRSRGVSSESEAIEMRERQVRFLNAKRESAREAKAEFFEHLPVAAPADAAEEAVQAAEIAEAVVESVESSESSDVSVVSDPSEASEPSEVQEESAASEASEVSEVSQVSEVSEVPEESRSSESIKVLREYYSIGAVEVQVDAAGLEALRNNPAVAKVLPNLERRIDQDRGTISDFGISLNESAPVVNSDAVANITVNSSNLTGHGEIICVIDTGLDTSHLLFGPVVEGSNIVGGIFGGYDFVNNDANATDDNNHGTHVSGIAVGNFSPYYGTARNAQVVPVKVCDGGGSCPDAAILAGVDYCNNNITGTTVISGSLGGGAPLNSSTCSADTLFPSLEPLLTTSLGLGIIPVFASGNNGCGAGCTTGVDYPACSPQVISVGSTTKADAISTFTDRGGDRFDIYAPGQSIVSSIPTFNAIQSVSGTSQATPHVSGAIAVFQQNEKSQGRARINLSTMRQLLQQTGVPIAPNNSRMDMYSVIMKRNLNYSANATSFLIRNDTINTSILFRNTTNFTGSIGCIDLAPNFAGVNSTGCPQYNKSAHVVLGGVRVPSIPYVDGALCPSSKCANMTITSRGLEMDVQGFSNFTSVPGCPALLNASAALNASIASNESCIIFGVDNIELDCAGFTITGTRNGSGVNATGRQNVTVKNCIIANFTNNILFSGTNGSYVLNATTTNSSDVSISLVSAHNNTVNDSSVANGPLDSHGVQLSAGGGNRLARVRSQAVLAGIRLTGSSNNVVHSSNVSGAANQGLILLSGSDNNTFYNISSTASNVGVVFFASRANVLENSTADSTSIGVSVQNENDTRVVNVSAAASLAFEVFQSLNINVTNVSASSPSGLALSVLGSTNVTVDRSAGLSASTHGISVVDSNTTFIRNSRANATGAAGDGIHVDNTGDYMYNISIINSTGMSNVAGTSGIAVSEIIAENGTGLNMTDSAGSSVLGNGITIGSNMMNGYVARSNATSPAVFAFNVMNVNNFTFINNTGNQTANTTIGFSINACTGCLLENNLGVGHYGFTVDGGMDTVARHNLGYGNGNNALRFSGTNHTITNNSGVAVGAGVAVEMTLTNSTVSNISAQSDGIAMQISGGLQSSFNRLSASSSLTKGLRVLFNGRHTISNVSAFGSQLGIELDTAHNNTFVNVTGLSLTTGIEVVGSSNNSFVGCLGAGNSTRGISVVQDSNISFDSCVGSSITGDGIALTFMSNGTSIANSTFASDTGDAVELGQNNGAANSTFTNVTLQANVSWISALPAGLDNNFTSTVFDSSSGSVRIIGNFTMPNGSTIDVARVNTSLNLSFVNSSNLTFLNQSAQITLRGLPFSNARPRIDVNDSGVFEQCLSPQCTIISYGGGTFIFNVSGFTSYASEESGGVSIVKADSVDPVVKGALFNYTITVNNSNNFTIFNVTVNETYPQGVSFISGEPTPTGNATFTIGTLAANTSFQINISVRAGSNLANGTILNNSARVVFAPANGTNGSVNVSELTTIRGIPSIITNKSDSPDPVPRGTTLNYQLTINNTGDEIAYNVTVIEGYPSNTVFNGSSPAPSSGNNTFAVGNLTPNQSTTINITLNVSPSLANGSILNNSYNLSLENLTGGIQTLTNSTLTAVLGSPNISANKSDSSDPVFAGDQFIYRITLNNTGDDTAFNITVIEGYPQGVSFVSAQPTPTGNNTFTISNLSPSAQFIINITLQAGSNLVNGTVLNNTANISFANRSSQNATTNVSENTTVVQPPSLTVNKTVNQSTVVKGTTLNYTITINNTGSTTAFNVTVLELYPSGVAFISSEPTPTSGNGTFNVGDLLPNQSTTINLTINFSVTLANATIKNNSLNITANRTDGRNVTPQNTSAVTTVIGFPQMSVIKSDTPDPVVNGTVLTYVITVTNGGDEIAYNVTVTEGYPANVTLLTTQPIPTPDNATFQIGNLLPGQTFLINITVNVSGGMISGQLNNSVNVTFANASGVNMTLQNSTLTTVIPPPVPFVAGGGGGGGGGGAAGTAASQSMSGNAMTTNYLRMGDKVNFQVNALDHTMTVLTVLTDRVSIRVASVPQEFTLKRGAVQAVDVTGDGQSDIRISVTDIAYSKALFYLEKTMLSPAVVRDAVPAPAVIPPVKPAAEPVKDSAPVPTPVPEVLREPLLDVVPQEDKSSGVGSYVMLAGALLVIAGIAGAALFLRKSKSDGSSQDSVPQSSFKSSSSSSSSPSSSSSSSSFFSSLSSWWASSEKPEDALAQARKIDEALREMKKGVKESEHLVKKAEKLDRKGKK